MEGQQKRQWGVTNPISEAQPTEADLKLNDQLVDYLKAKNNFETPEGADRRKKVLAHLQKVTEEFIRRVGKAKKLPPSTVDSLGGKLFTFGSYALGVFGPTSDIDTLVLAPKQVALPDFFDHFPPVFHELSQADQVGEFNPVTDAFVPIIAIEYMGVSIDLLFASLPSVSSIPSDLELTDVTLLRGLDPVAMRSLNGTRVTKEMLECVPQPKSFRHALRAIKLWSNQRGIYGAIYGYPGGVAWAIMVARICQLYPYACGATVVSKFFNLMRKWHWPRPVLLKEVGGGGPLNLPVWNPQVYGHDRAHIMPVITPSYPQMCATHNVMHSTFDVMMAEFERADDIIGNIQHGRKTWDDLFQRHTFFTKDHKYYLSVVASCTTKKAHESFSGLVQSKVRLLAKSIDESEAVERARPYMKGFERLHRCTSEEQIERVRKGGMEYAIKKDDFPKDGDQPSNGDAPTIVYSTSFYIGLTVPEAGSKSLDISFPVSDFRRFVEDNSSYDASTMAVRVVHTRGYQLPDDVFVEGDIRPTKPVKEKKEKKNKKVNGTTKAGKRQFAETGIQDSEKSSKKRVCEAANGLPTPTPA